MANELEQFVESNKQRLTEVNASNPQLYSAISMALDYLNKQYFGGTTELKVDIPQPTPVTPVQSTQADSVERLFTDEELANQILDNFWSALDLEEKKIELTSNIQKENFLNLVKLLLGRKDRYSTLGNIGNYFLIDKDLVVYNSDDETSFNKSPYTLLYYNQIFEDLLKSKPTATKLPSVWDSAYSSKNYMIPIDYNFLQKAIYSNRRSKDMKLEIARAFGEIKSISRAVATNWDEVEKNYGKTTADSIYQYQLNDEVFKIIEDKGFDFDFFNVTQYSDLDVKDWISELIFQQFEDPLKFDDIKEKLLEWYRNQVNKPTTQTPPTPQDPNLQNAKFKVGDRVEIIAQGAIYTTYTKMFKKMGFANQIKNDEGKDGDIGTIFAVEYNNEDKRILYGVLVELGATRKYQTLISERGLELFQPTPLSASKFEVGDWVRLVNDDSMVGVKKGDIGLVTKFDIDDDPYIEWQDKDLTNVYAFRKEGVELALKKPKPIFKIGDLVRWKEDVYNYNVKKGAYASVVGFGVFDGNILANVEWVDTKYNKAKVGGQSDGGYNEDFFELALSNEKAEEIAEDVSSKITTKTFQPEETTLSTTSEDEDEEDFEDLADQLENLDF